MLLPRVWLYLCGLPAVAQPFLYVANQNTNTVQVINTRDNRPGARINTGFAPASVAISPDGTRAYIPNVSSNTLQVVNTATNSTLVTLGSGQQIPVAVAVS